MALFGAKLVILCPASVAVGDNGNMMGNAHGVKRTHILG